MQTPTACCTARTAKQGALVSDRCLQNMTGKVVFITGASTGIGRAAANRFAAAGATVVGTSRWPWRYPVPPNW